MQPHLVDYSHPLQVPSFGFKIEIYLYVTMFPISELISIDVNSSSLLEDGGWSIHEEVMLYKTLRIPSDFDQFSKLT